MYLHQQNAGIVIYKDKEKEDLIFEFYELSPLNGPVCTTAGRLRRTFPDIAVRIAISVVIEPKFLATLCDTIASMSANSVTCMIPKISVGDKLIPNTRDTVHPGVVNMLLAGWLLGYGECATVYPIDKHTRNEISCGDELRDLIWRRSPLWLHLRVMMQIQLHRQTSPAQATSFYKQFMTYFHSQILQCTLDKNLGSDSLASIKAKVAYRLQKLATPDVPHWMQAVEATLNRANERIEARWQSIQKEHTLETPSKIIDIQHSDAQLLLTKVDVFIKLQTQSAYSASSAAPIQFIELIGFSTDLIPTFPPMDISSKDLLICQLGAFERWVEYNLDAFLSKNLKSPTTAANLLLAIEDYHSFASDVYCDDPEGLSTMYLVIMELYCACDQSTAALTPMLLDYAIPIPREIFSCLLLRRKEQLQRLKKVQEYLYSRPGQEPYRDCPILSSTDQSSFACRYATKDGYQKDVLQTISKAWDREEKKKQKELDDKVQNVQHQEVEIGDQDCLFDVDEDGASVHNPKCPKCRQAKDVEDLRITTIFPILPKDSVSQKIIVFELQIPQVFKAWRDASFYLLSDVLAFDPNFETQSVRSDMKSYTRLDDFKSIQKGGNLVTLGYKGRTANSTVKVTQDSTFDNVCLKHELCWCYIAKNGKMPISFSKKKTDEDSTFFNSCVFKLPSKSASLQQYLPRPYTAPTGTLPNHSLARQCEHPSHLSQSECKGLCDLAYGERQQWHSILMQLAQPTVDWRKVESLLFLLQTTLHSGMFDTIEEAWNTRIDLSQDQFACLLLETLQQMQRRTAGN